MPDSIRHPESFENTVFRVKPGMTNHIHLMSECISWTLLHLSMDAGKQNSPTWKDPQTGLEWQRDSPGEMTWYEARRYAASLSLDGKNDWRLPTLAELESLLDRARGRSDGRPPVRREVPFQDNSSYWSSTTFRRHTKTAWIVMFDGAYVLSYYKRNLYHVRCVRG